MRSPIFFLELVIHLMYCRFILNFCISQLGIRQFLQFAVSRPVRTYACIAESEVITSTCGMVGNGGKTLFLM